MNILSFLISSYHDLSRKIIYQFVASKDWRVSNMYVHRMTRSCQILTMVLGSFNDANIKVVNFNQEML